MCKIILNVNVVAILLVLFLALPSTIANAQIEKIGASGLPIPRFVSLKSDKVNVRIGPSRDHGIAWTFVRAGLPVEIIQEFDNWRRIRDWEGSEGWVFHSLLSGRRTALIKPWEEGTTVPLYSKPSLDANIIAELESKVRSTVSECDSSWCKITVSDRSGWVVQSELFGIYPDESVN